MFSAAKVWSVFRLATFLVESLGERLVFFLETVRSRKRLIKATIHFCINRA
tara:strand:+ start:276 stop:428 length:153 start_codon:yes stop_codon:yes gene_type:complete